MGRGAPWGVAGTRVEEASPEIMNIAHCKKNASGPFSKYGHAK